MIITHFWILISVIYSLNEDYVKNGEQEPHSNWHVYSLGQKHDHLLSASELEIQTLPSYDIFNVSIAHPSDSTDYYTVYLN